MQDSSPFTTHNDHLCRKKVHPKVNLDQGPGFEPNPAPTCPSATYKKYQDVREHKNIVQLMTSNLQV